MGAASQGVRAVRGVRVCRSVKMPYACGVCAGVRGVQYARMPAQYAVQTCCVTVALPLRRQSYSNAHETSGNYPERPDRQARMVAPLRAGRMSSSHGERLAGHNVHSEAAKSHDSWRVA